MKVLIECERGSCIKSIYDERTFAKKRSGRVALPYPYPYGWIVGTRGEDGGAVDCYVITNDPLSAGTIVECEPLGILEMSENGEVDHKILAAVEGRPTTLDDDVYQLLQGFIFGIFSRIPGACVLVGKMLPREDAEAFIRSTTLPVR